VEVSQLSVTDFLYVQSRHLARRQRGVPAGLLEGPALPRCPELPEYGIQHGFGRDHVLLWCSEYRGPFDLHLVDLMPNIFSPPSNGR
jgi:hypothetical protein